MPGDITEKSPAAVSSDEHDETASPAVARRAIAILLNVCVFRITHSLDTVCCFSKALVDAVVVASGLPEPSSRVGKATAL